MDYFSLVFTCLCLIGQGIIHIIFISRLTGKGQKIWHYALYLLLLGILEWSGTHFPLPGIFGIPAQLLVLYSMSRFALGNQRPVSWVAAILAVYISRLSFGMVNSVEAAAFPYVVGKPLLYPLILLAALLGTLYVYQRLCHSLQAQAALHSITQAARAQKIYIAETQTLPMGWIR